MESRNVTDLARGVRRGDRRSIARAITQVELGGEVGTHLLEKVGSSLENTFVVGFTGPPGTGKSTLVDRMIEEYRKMRLKVGVVAVDPTSPITGGALLGDRIRMLRHTMDEGVYIRSLASRGWSGGLSGAVSGVVQVLGASGCDIVLVETVGIGQADIEIMRVAHAVVIVTMPGLGDEVQVSKAGLMEIGDVYVVNKADLPGADSMVVGLLGLMRDSRGRGRGAPVLKVSALTKEGIDLLVKQIERLRSLFLSDEGEKLRLRSTQGMITELAKRRLISRFDEDELSTASAELARRVMAHELSIEKASVRLADLATTEGSKSKA